MAIQRPIDWQRDLASTEVSPLAGNLPIQVLNDTAQIEQIRKMRETRSEEWAECKGFSDVGVVFQDEYIVVVRDPVVFPTGRIGTYLRVFERPGLDGAAGSVVVPHLNGTVYFQRIYRHATGMWELEFPRGYRDNGEEPDNTACRELQEETGLRVKRLTSLGDICPNTGLLASRVEAFWADLETEKNVRLSMQEEAVASFHAFPVREIPQLLGTGKVRDGFSLSALALALGKGLLGNQ